MMHPDRNRDSMLVFGVRLNLSVNMLKKRHGPLSTSQVAHK